MGFSVSVYASFSCKLFLVSLCKWNCSQEFIIEPLFSWCKMFNVSSIFPYICPVSRMCWAYLDVVLLVFMACICSLNLILKFLSVCPTYFFGQLLHLISYTPHWLYLPGIYICYVEESRPPLWSSGQVPGCRTEMYCVSCEVRTEFIYVM
jgi:hypothetical protein